MLRNTYIVAFLNFFEKDREKPEKIFEFFFFL